MTLSGIITVMGGDTLNDVLQFSDIAGPGISQEIFTPGLKDCLSFITGYG
jgi:hypothetical protein